MLGHQGDLLHRALAARELPQFLMGDPPYFFEAKTDNPEPQNVQQAFDLQLVRYWSLTRRPDLPQLFVASLRQLVESYPDRDKALYVVNNWIYTYFSALAKKTKEAPLGIYSELFKIDMRPVTDRMRPNLEVFRSNLVLDTRWAGATWNSSNGLWEPILRTAKAVRDLGGPDYVSQDA